MTILNPNVANLLIGAIDSTAANPPIAFGGSPLASSGTGIYGSYGSLSVATNGVDSLRIIPASVSLLAAGAVAFAASAAGIKTTNDFAIITNSGTPVNGTSGTGFGYAGPGSLCIDYAGKVIYVNTNTKASPTWAALAFEP